MQQTITRVEHYRQNQGSHEELLSELTEQGVSLSAVGENSLHIKGEITPTQKEYVQLWKQELIETLSPKKQPATLTDILNRFIERGITFDVSADDFQASDADRILKTSDKEFLKLNSAAILCHLQQSLLMKHWFSYSPEQFEDFAFEITERECLSSPLRITDKTRFEIYVEAVKSTTRKWFEDLLEMGETNK